MMKLTMHMILKYNDSVYNVDSIKEHQEIISKNGKVIWGVIKPNAESRGIAEKRFTQINGQIESDIETLAFFSTSGNVLAKGKILKVLSREEVRKSKHLVPEYYHADLNNCVAGILLESIVEVSSTVIEKFQRYGTEGGVVALGNQTNPLYISLKDEDITDLTKHVLSKDFVLKKDWQRILNDEIKEYLQNIGRFISSLGFILTNEDLCNFYLSLKTKPFVILAGISGTGKSKMVRLFAEAIGANTNNQRFRMISVKPDWNDSTELFGYINISDQFIPGILTDTISEANKNKDLPYLVCLDEMNLARVEYYFSEYLSLIESRRREGGGIITDRINNGARSNNQHDIELTIPENLYIVGTVNMDDTTFGFSRKVLDRANTIEYSEVELSKLFLDSELDDEIGNITVHNDFIKSCYLNLQDIESEHRNFAKMINEKIVAINQILMQGKKHFAYRVREEIIFYMIENKKLGLLADENAFDYQLLQKILPSLNGGQAIVKEILVDLFNFCMNSKKVLSETEYLEDAESYLSDAIYPKSAKKIIEMMKGYRYDGFSSFWF